MSDFPVDIDAGLASTQSPPPGPSTTPPVASTPGVGSVDVDELPADQQVFNRAYVQDIRNREQGYRTQLREAQERLDRYAIFDQYDPADQDIWMGMLQQWVVDPVPVAQAMRQIADSLLGAPNGNGAAMSDQHQEPPPLDPNAPLSRDELRALLAESMDERFAARDQEAAQRAAVAEVHNELRQAGFDPVGADAMWIMHTAHHETNGDIGAAVQKWRDKEQAIYDQRVEAARQGRQAPLAPSNGQVATSTPPAPTNFRDIGRAAQAFIDGQRTSQPGQA